VLIADAGSHSIRAVNLSSNALSTLAGCGLAAFLEGSGTGACFSSPAGLAANSSVVAVGDTGNHRVRLVSPEGLVSTLAGSGSASFADGWGSAASFSSPSGLAFGSSSGGSSASLLYLCDRWNQRVRAISPGGYVSTLAGSGLAGFADSPAGSSAQFSSPVQLHFLPEHHFLRVQALLVLQL